MTSPAPLPVLFRDEHYVAVHKPSGLLVHRSEVAGGEREFALQRVRDQVGQRLWTVHRLDRPTSGVLLFALSHDAGRLASAAFEAERVAKRYLAVVRGFVETAIDIDYPLTDVADRRIRTLRDPEQARPARTAVSPLSTVELPHAVGRYPTARYSLVSLAPTHGRRHQLRRHLKHVFHPIVGDVNYGDGRHNRFFREQFDCHRLMLHAERLAMAHPLTGEPLDLRAPPDGTFAAVLEATGLRPPSVEPA